MEPRELAGTASAGVDFEAARHTIGVIKAQLGSCSAKEEAEQLMGEARIILAALIPLVEERARQLPCASLECRRACDTVARARTALTWTHTSSSITYLGYVVHVAGHLLGYFPVGGPDTGEGDSRAATEEPTR
ncbi:hypothetical protein [Streptomyces sp. NRRL F-5755]|uniref:hypothetical protein n=1 Tax=Streptomyces sp. NRRL F-5755 TaxID=1519475 RepID=UPI0013319A43|nr:hypothetical protein [Streptomyces sp. NRRL F-5755]